ncbi:MAG: hypothetical protein IKF64_06645 [Eubacterium sp.]|nr:hypothetical protein [Eubacterium sp.]
MKDIAYSGYNQVTCDRICDYLKKHEIKFSVALTNPFMGGALVRNKTIIKVKKGILTDAKRSEIQAIIDSSIEF